jgi:hypothetical protein
MPAAILQKNIIYWILPSIITLSCILIYYFNWFGLEELIAPEINREFGLVENLQLVLLLVIFFIAIKGFCSKTIKMAKYGFLVIAIIAIFMFLEEIDYGLHYYEYLTGKGQTQVVVFDQKVRNIHNNGPLQNLFKLAAYTIIVVFFVIFPLIPANKKEKFPLLNFLRPSRYIISTAISLLVLNQLALYLYRMYNSPNRSLSGNVSEFEEIMIYYILMLYIIEMVKKPEAVLSKELKLYHKHQPD